MLKIRDEYSEYVTKSFRIPKEILVKLENLAGNHNTSVNKVIVQCLEYALSETADYDQAPSSK